MTMRRGGFITLLMSTVMLFASWAAASDDEVWRKFMLLSEALSLVKSEYVEDVETEKLMYGAIKGMLQTLDPYSQFLDPVAKKQLESDTQGQFGGLGLIIGIRNEKLTVIAPIEGTPAFRAGVQSGDQISEIDGKPTSGLSVDEAAGKLRGEPGTKVTIQVVREGEEQPLELTLSRDIISEQSVKHKIVDKDIGYIRISQFKKVTAADATKALNEFEASKVSGIILDLRNNPGGILDSAIEVASNFLSEGDLLVYTERRDGKRQDYFAQGKGLSKRYPLIVLVNNGSASGSEIVAGAIKDNKRGLIMGIRTFGKASVQTIFPLDNDFAVKLTIAHYYTPNGTYINKIGVSPDINYPSLSAAELRMYRKLRSSDKLKNFIAEPEVGEKLKKAGGVANLDAGIFQAFMTSLEKEQIFLNEDLAKLALATETLDDSDDYLYDPQINEAIKYLRAFEIFNK